MKDMGASEEVIQQHIQHMVPDDVCEVLPENWDTVAWFLEVDDLFRYESSVCLGLDVTAIKNDCEMSQRSFTPEEYKGLRLIGKEAAVHLNKQLKSRRH
ncbi:hypothetical protein [Glaciecola sp. 1036]|uniref:hypothetical protein n=1 Tax=Alteromonadaceae TaxID=72275 RepID=UPI003CFD7758